MRVAKKMMPVGGPGKHGLPAGEEVFIGGTTAM